MTTPKPPALDPADVASSNATGYPEPYRSRVAGRHKKRLGDAAGLKNFGVNLTTLGPGAESSMRHWHEKQDEFVFVLEGEVTLVTNAGRQRLKPGMCAGFPAGRPDGHQLVNETDKPAVYLEIGDRTPGDSAIYADPDVDLTVRLVDGRWVYSHKDGRPYR
ncbi:MAG TPA: cupin domain-containing protein [Burkholderiales bacterium]|nr:cupin domain-containing protein [Burkholderiales bacterium]